MTGCRLDSKGGLREAFYTILLVCIKPKHLLCSGLKPKPWEASSWHHPAFSHRMPRIQLWLYFFFQLAHHPGIILPWWLTPLVICIILPASCHHPVKLVSEGHQPGIIIVGRHRWEPRKLGAQKMQKMRCRCPIILPIRMKGAK